MVQDDAHAGDEMSPGEHTQMGRKHILCINGAPSFLDVLRELFQEERYNVTTTNYVDRTIDLVTALQPDLIVLDLEVGLRAGWDLLEQLAREASTQGFPVVITSTERRLLETAAADPQRYGGHAHVVKPLDLDALLAVVRELIGVA